MLKCKEIYDVSQTKQFHLLHISRLSERCGVNMDPHLPEPLSDCLEDGLTSNDAILIDQDGGDQWSLTTLSFWNKHYPYPLLHAGGLSLT